MDWTTLKDALQAANVEIFTLGTTEFTVYSLGKLLLLIVGLFWLASLIRRWVVRRVLTHTRLDNGTRESIGSILRYLVLISGFMLILQNVGVNLSALSVVAGAVGVGVGFGLQNIFSNFISGVIIMLERPIKVGDRVEVGGVEGTVREIGARRTTIVTHDNITILIPNQRFITDNVVNLVYADAPLRLRVPISIAAATDVEAARSLLLDAAAGHSDVLTQPAPTVLIPSLGDSKMNFELSVWHEPRGATRQQLMSDLNTLVAQRMAAVDMKRA